MCRPRNDDERPEWSVTASWIAPGGGAEDEYQQRLHTALEHAGAHRPVIDAVVHDRLTVTLSIRGDGPHAAERTAIRLVEETHRAAGLGALGPNLDRLATVMDRSYPHLDEDG